MAKEKYIFLEDIFYIEKPNNYNKETTLKQTFIVREAQTKIIFHLTIWP